MGLKTQLLLGLQDKTTGKHVSKKCTSQLAHEHHENESRQFISGCMICLIGMKKKVQSVGSAKAHIIRHDLASQNQARSMS